MSTQPQATAPITSLATPAEQHMLFLFFPLKKGTLPQALEGARSVFGTQPTSAASQAESAAGGIDSRVQTGVHFFMFYGLPADTTPQPPLPVPSFQTSSGKDLMVVISLYDADFGPYISAFTSQPPIALGLDEILRLMDESDLVDPSDPSSAAFILSHGGVAKNNSSFLELLMRYNFGDPTIPAANVFPVNTPANPKYRLGATFPGLTVGSILQSYPQAESLWPLPAPAIQFAPSTPPAQD
jgi:hypothetical protein